MLYFDSQKNAENLKKHGISFEAASFALEDPYAIEQDYQIVEREQRLITIGMAAVKWSFWFAMSMTTSMRIGTRWRVSYMQED